MILMQKTYILFLAALFINVSLSKASNTIDSVGVENNKGKKLILHKVDAKETYYSIAKRYSVNYKDIMTFNDSKFLQIGIVIKVPTNVDFTANQTTTVAGNANQTEYTIKAKDNLNMLAQRFGTTVEEIKRVNNLNSINLQIGQVLVIPGATQATTTQPVSQQIPATVTPNVPKATVNTPVATPNENAAIIEHTIKAKENLNLLAEKYGTTVEEIKRINGLSSNNLRIGQVLKIANVNQLAVENTVVATPVTTVTKPIVKPIAEQPIQQNTTSVGYTHNVLAGETIYSIAKKYGLTTYQIKTANNLTKDEVVVGQKLIIKDASRSVAETGTDEPTEDDNTIKDPSLRQPASKYGITQIEEKGTAVWIADQDLDPNKMLVLHRSATVGTIIKVTNPMSNRSAFAKVVGKFTENESTKDVIIVMTKAVADAVGALDKRFYCNINYGAQENEQQ
ncbi:MAG: LysM peptidoglycan-binding domain-containing protein [Flavobacteriales bacterium]|nr:MAG: LysM peptidoglycan-binding domain-containing protein [Flavobacteriales bacterium]